MATMTTKRGDNWKKVFFWRNKKTLVAIDLTGCAARLHLKKKREDPPLIEADEQGNELAIDGPAGKVRLNISAATMRDIAYGNYKSDLELTFPDGTVLSTETFEVKVTEDQTV